MELDNYIVLLNYLYRYEPINDKLKKNIGDLKMIFSVCFSY